MSVHAVPGIHGGQERDRLQLEVHKVVNHHICAGS